MTTTSQTDINTANAVNALSNGNAAAAATTIVKIGSNAGLDVNCGGNGSSSGCSIENIASNRTAGSSNGINKNLNNGSVHKSNNSGTNNAVNNLKQNIIDGNAGVNSSVGGSTSNQRDAGKRKKLKSRNHATTLNTNNYTKDHLDAWLETCLKDASNTQLSSSSEFLDYNPTIPTTSAMTLNGISTVTAAGAAALAATTAAPAPTSNKNIFIQQQQQQQSQQQQQQSIFSSNSNQQNYFTSNPNSQQQQFTLRTNSQPTLPFPSGYHAPFSQGFQRNIPSFATRHNNSFNNRFSMMFPSHNGNNFYMQNDGSQDFASLPPIVNLLGGIGNGGNSVGGGIGGAGSSEHENNSTDVLDGSGSNPNMCRGFRFSDPCLLNPSDNDSKISGQNTPDQRNNLPNDMEQNKFFTALMEQINLLHETNSKICRNLHETKVDIEALKHAPNWGIRHRRDSLSGLSTHSQPMIFGGGFGTQSPAPTYHSGAYTPGMMTDIVREVKEAARVREDALINRIKSMVEERQWSMNESNLRMLRDIEELRTQINQLRSDRKETNKRLTHLEAENKYMRQILSTLLNNRNNPSDIIYEKDTLRNVSRKQQTRRSMQPLNLHYGTIHSQPPTATLAVEEEEVDGSVPLTTTTSTTPSTSIEIGILNEQRISCSSSDGGNIGANSGGGVSTNYNNSTQTTGIHTSSTVNGHQQLQSPPNFALISAMPIEPPKRRKERTPNRINEGNIKRDNAEQYQQQQQQSNVVSEKQTTQHLRKELNEAMTAQQEANERIIALEKLVKKLQVNSTHHNHHHQNNRNTENHNSNGVGNVSNGNSTTPALNSTTAFKLHHPTNNISASTLGQKQYPMPLATTTNISSISVLTQSPPKLSVAGPITDL